MPVIGTQQSPIHIRHDATLAANFPQPFLRIEYPNADLPGTFDGENFEFQADRRPLLLLKNQQWLAHFIHIHHPAEHRLDDLPVADFECHLVHFAAADTLRQGPKVVIGSFLHKRAGAATPPGIQRLNRTLAQGHRALSCSNSRGIEINPTEFLPSATERDRWYHYYGSLTTDAFSEDVTWFVMAHEIAVSADDVDHLMTAADQHARKVQALDRRIVLRSFVD
jgi:carbonic anhydrase